MSTPYDSIINTASQQYGVPAKLIDAVIKQESGFNPSAVSSAGAEGLMQLMPSTAAGLGVTNPFDPTQNIMGGTRYLSGLIKEFGGSIPLGLAAYNAGAGNVRKYGGIPPFTQTQNYVKNIMSMYTNGNFDITSVGTSSTAQGSANNAFQNITIPQTSYQVVPNSYQFGDILYGRRYRIIVSNASGIALDVSDLRCTFNIQKTIMQQPPISEVVLYNLNADTENAIIEEGARIVVEAGYEGSQYGLIFDGDIVQPIRDKQDATTYRLTLRSIDGDRFINYGFVGFSLVKGQSARDQIGALASQAKYPTQLGTISENLDGTKLTRGKVMFGLAKDYLSQIAKSQNATYYMHNGTVNLIKATDYPANTIVDLSPTSGLINTPTQSQYGVSFTAMLNPKIQINSLVHIDNSLIRAQSFEQGQPIRNLDQDGIYRVTSITYVGDTRGSDWNIQCDTVSQAGLIPGNANGLSTNATFNPYGSS